MGITSILAGCQFWSKEPEMYQGQKVYLSDDVVKIPFSLKEQGASLDVLARPDSKGKFLVAGLIAARDASWDYGDDNSKRFRALIPDGPMWQKPDGRWVTIPENLKPFKLRVQIDSVAPDIGVHTVQTLEINSKNSMSLPNGTNYYSENLAPFAGLKSPNASPGIYRVRITNLEARPDVDWIPMFIQIGAHRGKP